MSAQGRSTNAMLLRGGMRQVKAIPQYSHRARKPRRGQWGSLSPRWPPQAPMLRGWMRAAVPCVRPSSAQKSEVPGSMTTQPRCTGARRGGRVCSAASLVSCPSRPRSASAAPSVACAPDHVRVRRVSMPRAQLPYAEESFAIASIAAAPRLCLPAPALQCHRAAAA